MKKIIGFGELMLSLSPDAFVAIYGKVTGR